MSDESPPTNSPTKSLVEGHPEEHPGQSGPVGQYYLIDKIARGGMAEIYKGLAYDLHGIKRTVVIKKILPQIAADKSFVDMLVQEAKLAVMLSHGNIAQIYDLGKVDDDYFIVMEYVDGLPLSKVFRRQLTTGNMMPIDIVCSLISEVAAGLHYMHQKTSGDGRPLHIIHRDMSPQNVMISKSGTIKIIDFGIAKAAAHVETTDSGILKGKFAYMSPEQSCGSTIDHRSDIFSLGIVLHELLTGKRLFKSDEKKETLKNVRRAIVDLPSNIRRDIPNDLDKIVLKALAKHPKKRYQSAGEFRDDLVRFLHTRYPDFRANSISEFLKALFIADFADEDNDDSKTPFLIIDRTQSAIQSDFEDDEFSETASLRVNDEQEHEKNEPTEKIDLNEEKSDSEQINEEDAEINISDIEPPPKTRLKKVILAIVTLALFAYGALNYQRFIPIDETPTTPTVPIDATQSKPIPEAPHKIQLVVTSTPHGAKIFLDDIDTGKITPTDIQDITKSQLYQIGLFMEDYKYWTTQILPKNDVTKIHADLKINYGRLKIVSSPSDAIVEVDGHTVGRTPFEKIDLKPNSRIKIKIKKEDYETWYKDIKIPAGNTVWLNPTLKRL